MLTNKQLIKQAIKDAVMIFAVLLIISLLMGVVSATEMSMDTDNCTIGESYVKWCWTGGTPPYQVIIDDSVNITGWGQNCIVATDLKSGSMTTVYVVDSETFTLYGETTTDEDLFTSNLAWYIYLTIGLLVISLISPMFVFLAWFTGLLALIEVLNKGHSWIFVFFVGFLFVAGFLRLAVRRER